MSEAATGRKLSEQAKQKVSQFQKGRKKDENTKKKMSEAWKKIICCPHCDKLGNGPAMRRWHFDYCKKKQ